VSRYLVTGCAGFIGSHLAEALIAAGHEVRGIDCFTPYYERSVKQENVSGLAEQDAFAFSEGDLAQVDLTHLLDGIDGVFHLAAQAGVRTSWGGDFDVYVHHNLLATQRLFEASVEAGCRVVFASSSSVYGNALSYPTREDDSVAPVSPYGVTKLSCELLARAYASSFGLDFVALRYFTIYGPRQRPDMAVTRIVGALIEGTPFEIYGDGEQSREFTYVADAVRATIDSMDSGRSGAAYNVGGGAETTLRSVIETCERLSGRRLELIRLPAAKGDARRTAADTSRIRTDLGWSPSTSVEEGLAAQLAWAESRVRG
jgi:UDP-glucuronate 4-epimerase